jgi:glutamyl/glutaminyl-tRNA synthetase
MTLRLDEAPDPPRSVVDAPLMHSALRLVSDRLPHLRELAAQLFERDEAFREMCDEYQLCKKTEARMTRTAGTAGAVRKEYVALGLRLEGELLRYLAENTDE